MHPSNSNFLNVWNPWGDHLLMFLVIRIMVDGDPKHILSSQGQIMSFMCIHVEHSFVTETHTAKHTAPRTNSTTIYWYITWRRVGLSSKIPLIFHTLRSSDRKGLSPMPCWRSLLRGQKSLDRLFPLIESPFVVFKDQLKTFLFSPALLLFNCPRKWPTDTGQYRWWKEI